MTASKTKPDQENKNVSSELSLSHNTIQDVNETLIKSTGKSLNDLMNSPEFRKSGIDGIESYIREHVPTSGDISKLLEFLGFLKSNKDNLIKILDPDKKGIRKFRQAGHFVDQKLKYEYPQKNQITIFDLVESDRVKTKIDKHDFEVKAVGVRLTPPEDKLLNALQRLLHEKSQNTVPDDPDYYKGNVPSDLVPFGKEKRDSPTLRIRPSELYKAYLDNPNYTGPDIHFIKNVLMDLSAKKFLMVFDRKRKIKKNGKIETVTDRIEEFQSLIRVIKYTEGIGENELKRLNEGDDSPFDRKGELIIGLNPILVEQINSKYVEYPSNINKRMVIAAGGHRFVTEAMNTLRDFLLREISSKRFRIEINEERLPYILKLEKYIKSRQRKRIENRIQDAIRAVKNLGILTSVSLVKGSQGQMKYIFDLNPDFE